MQVVLTEDAFSRFEFLSLRLAATIAEHAAEYMCVRWMECHFDREQNTWECTIEFGDIFDK